MPPKRAEAAQLLEEMGKGPRGQAGVHSTGSQTLLETL